jgi:glycosyltransferase involved in cell wall biosynthesis
MGTMKVAVIAAEMEGRATGVGRYLRGLLHGLESWDHGVEWHLFFQGDPWSTLALPEGPFHPHFSRRHGSRVLWEQVVVSRAVAEVEPDVVFGPAYTLPFGLRAPSVVTIHDLSFEVLPEEFDLRERWRRRLLARRAARVARRVITDTEHLSSLVGERYGVVDDRMAVVPLGVDQKSFSTRGDGDDIRFLKELEVCSPYVLLPGTVLERRMPRQVLEAFAIVRRDRPELGLVIAGANRLRRPENLDIWIEELGLERSVRRLGWVEESALAPLYRGAELGIYVSRHEGYGLPPLECLACGTPVVVSAGLGLDDAWSDYPYRTPELGKESIAGVMKEILGNMDRTVRVMEKTGSVLACLGWEQSSRRLVAELGRVLSP